MSEAAPMPADLQRAAAATLERIRKDRKKAPARLRPLLDYLEKNLFDPDLDASQLKRACGVRDNSASTWFHQALSLPPYAYIEDCRMEVACRLLRDTELKIWQIAQLLGYSSPQIFGQAFRRWSGIRPSVYRGRCRALESSRPDYSAPLRPVCFETFRKAVNGELSKPEADELSCRLAELYPQSFCSPSAEEPSSAARGVLWRGCGALWMPVRVSEGRGRCCFDGGFSMTEGCVGPRAGPAEDAAPQAPGVGAGPGSSYDKPVARRRIEDDELGF